MHISKIASLLDAKILTSLPVNDDDIEFAFSSDMMSDVLAFADRHMLLITGLTNPQSVRTAEMLDISCILYVRGKVPPEAVITLAKDRNITVLTTHHSMFNTCGVLYEAGLKGGMENA